MLIPFLFVTLGTLVMACFALGVFAGFELGRREGWEDGFIQGHEAGHMDNLDPRPYVMEIKE